MSIILWIIIIYYLDYNLDYSNILPIYYKPIYIVPHNVKCLFNEPLCEQGNLAWGDLFILLSFYLLGKYYPGYIKYVVILSILYEIILIYFEKSAKLILGPMIAITGYLLGQL